MADIDNFRAGEVLCFREDGSRAIVREVNLEDRCLEMEILDSNNEPIGLYFQLFDEDIEFYELAEI